MIKHCDYACQRTGVKLTGVQRISRIYNFTIHPPFKTPHQMKSPKSGEPRTVHTAGGGAADKRCCLKTTTKHHRWKRKWNCCSSVPSPDSPDVSDDVIRTISDTIAAATVDVQTVHHESPAPMLEVPDEIYQMQQRQLRREVRQQRLQYEHELHQEQLLQRPARLNGMIRTASSDKKVTDVASASDISTSNTANNPVPNYNHQTATGSSSSGSATTARQPQTLKTTGQRPRMMRPWAVLRFRHVLRMIGRYRRPDCRTRHHLPDAAQNQVSPIDGGDEERPWSREPAVQNIPLSGHRRLPQLPPPSRRKIRNSTDLQELSMSLGFGEQQQQSGVADVRVFSGAAAAGTASSSRFLPSGSVRRMRRKNAMRQLSPTLSPIQESGQSNPTSPLPFRHASPSCGGNADYTLAIAEGAIRLNDGAT